jgi:putative oxidoreductase
MATGATAPALQPAPKRNLMLLIGGSFSLAFALFQLSCIWFPPSLLGYFGGPVEMSIQRPVVYALVCVAVAVAIAIAGFYALSGAGKIQHLPFLRIMLTGVTAVYLLRGLLLFPQVQFVLHHPGFARFVVFSAIALVVGLVHLGGLISLFRNGRPGEAAAAR